MQEATQRRQRVETSRRILQALVGDFPTGAESLLGALPVYDTGVPSGLPSELLERRPDLLAASAKVEGSRQRLRATERELFPRISLTGSLGSSSPELQEVLSPDYSIWQLAGNATQPLFSRGLIRGRIAWRKAAPQEEPQCQDINFLHTLYPASRVGILDELGRMRCYTIRLLNVC